MTPDGLLASAEDLRHVGEDRNSQRLRRIELSMTGAVWVCRLVVLVLPLLVWQRLADNGAIAVYIFSRPSDIWHKMVSWAQDGTLWSNAAITIGNSIVGYLLGVLLGIALAVSFYALPRTGQVLSPFMSSLNSMPAVAYAPLIVAWFGFGMTSSIVLVLLGVMFVNFFAVYTGLTSINDDYLTSARALGATNMQLWRTVRIPSVTGWLISALRASVGFALSAAIVAEFVAGTRGIGYLVSSSLNIFQPAGVYAGTAAIIILVIIIDVGLRFVERRSARWAGQ
jgi:NitT/TauT family transport system permease protein